MAGATSIQSFQFDAETGVWMNPRHQKFSYSEGASTELQTLQILKKTKDRSLFSEELLKQITTWPTLYHFSPARHNLLRHLQIGRETSILELGAGCGAITRQLGEVGGDVWAVEGGPVRAACAAARTSDLTNVRVFCSDFQDFDPGRTFDVVTLIGVLEYSPVFFKSADPFGECLRIARSFVKPGGVLLLAIENQLGLKYFLGSPEDHTGKPYDGVQDLYRTSGVKTVGRADLIRALNEAGFPQLQIHYPFPDYKLPNWVLTERGLSTEQFDPSAILRTVDSSHEGRSISLAADERKVRPLLHRNGLLGELANSFLVVAGSETTSPTLSPDNLLAAGYVTDRKPWFNTRTEMLVENDSIQVRKSRLLPAASPAGSTLTIVPGTETYRAGPQLEQAVVESLQRGNLDDAIALLRRWIDHLLSVGVTNRDQTDPYASILEPQFFDCTPSNLIVEGDSLKQIDAEWSYAGKLPVRTLALRYLKLLAAREDKLLRKRLDTKQSAAMELLQRLNIQFTKQQFQDAKAQLHDLNEAIVAPYRGKLPDRKKRGRRSFVSRLLGRKSSKA